MTVYLPGERFSSTNWPRSFAAVPVDVPSIIMLARGKASPVTASCTVPVIEISEANSARGNTKYRTRLNAAIRRRSGGIIPFKTIFLVDEFRNITIIWKGDRFIYKLYR